MSTGGQDGRGVVMVIDTDQGTRTARDRAGRAQMTGEPVRGAAAEAAAPPASGGRLGHGDLRGSPVGSVRVDRDE